MPPKYIKPPTRTLDLRDGNVGYLYMQFYHQKRVVETTKVATRSLSNFANIILFLDWPGLYSYGV